MFSSGSTRWAKPSKTFNNWWMKLHKLVVQLDLCIISYEKIIKVHSMFLMLYSKIITVFIVLRVYWCLALVAVVIMMHMSILDTLLLPFIIRFAVMLYFWEKSPFCFQVYSHGSSQLGTYYRSAQWLTYNQMASLHCRVCTCVQNLILGWSIATQWRTT